MDATAEMPGRRIVVCLDGTNNEPGEASTNVQRLYRMVARIPDEQLTYYQPGVGTLEPVGVVTAIWRRVLMVADSAGGWMMKRHVCSAYEYLCEQYRPGDELFLFGFSRGAQSARLLAGMLATVGLLHPGMREMVPFAWKAYTSWAPFSAFGQLRGRPRNKQAKRSYFIRAKRFKSNFCRPVKVRFLGLWDTVSSLGVPWNPKIYNFSDSNHEVRTVRHALSLDEHRVNFEPRFWRAATDAQDVRQLCFPGVHADVGGGYTGRAVETAKISLAWMVGELADTSIVFDPAAMAREKLPDLANRRRLGKAASRSRHDELQRWGWQLLEYLPFPRWIREGRGWRLSLKPHLGARRRFPGDVGVHDSVLCRMQHDAGYRPTNLPVSADAAVDAEVREQIEATPTG